MKFKINLKLIFQHLIVYFLITSILITSSVLTYQFGQETTIYSDESWDHLTPYIPLGYNESLGNIILDQHSHTRYSDGVMTVEQSVKWHISMGFNTFVITDHNNLRSLKEVPIKPLYLFTLWTVEFFLTTLSS